MAASRQYDYLIRTIYFPRIAGYFLAVLLSLSRFGSGETIPAYLVFLLVACLAYPHLVYWVSGCWFNSPRGARNSMMIDAVMVGLLVVANGYHLFLAVFFVSSLSLSTLIIARPNIMFVNWCILALVALGAWVLGAPETSMEPWLTNLLASISIVGYCSIVAHKGFAVTASMGNAKRSYRQNQQNLTLLTDRLRRYLSPQVYSVLQQLAGKESVSSRKRLTVFFSDIEGFTALMDNLEEELVTELLNEYLNSMTEIAITHGGTVDKFMGDGIMIFFGDPVSLGSKQDALACVRMALDMRRELRALRQKWQRAGIFSELHIRIGIHTGHCTVGNFGSDCRMDYTAVGSTVNLASRLESQAHSDHIIISEQTHQLICKDIDCLKLPVVSIKGIQRSVQTYDVLREFEQGATILFEKNCEGMLLNIDPKRVRPEAALALLAEATCLINALPRPPPIGKDQLPEDKALAHSRLT